MMKVNRLSAAIAVGVSLMGMGSPAWSLGFGRPVSRAILGETFNVTVPLRLEAGEILADDCLAADVFFGDDKVSSAGVNAVLLPGQGLDRVARVTTTALINEPVVTLYLSAGCKAKVTRKFVAFADPPMAFNAPVVSGGQPANTTPAGATGTAESVATPLASPVAGTPSHDTQSLAPNDAAQGKPGARERRRASGKGGSRASAASAQGAGEAATVVASAQPAVREPKSTSRARSKDKLSAKLDPSAKPTERARLVLDPVEADAMVAPNLMMTPEMVASTGDYDSPEAKDRRAAAAALWAAMNASPEQLARDRQRMQELEQRLAKLQQDAASAREKVVSMEARVREAEDARLSNPLVMGLGGACLLLAAAVGALIWRQRQRDSQSSWWQGDAAASDAAESAVAHEVSLAEPIMDRTAAGFVPVVSAPVTSPASSVPAPVPAPAPVAVSPAVFVPVAAPAPTSRPAMIKSEAQEAVREITVEELIDLEQQAEFFVVLGQDDAAVELLESHVQTTAGASPLPYLKLLEIYQRLGRKTEYEQVQADFNGRFNAYAPSWESDLQHGHALEEYPGVIERLQALWSPPSQAMDVLQKSLTRPDDSVETFDLPAYRELLFLYAVARDLSEREADDRAPVDLLGQAAQNLMGVVEPALPEVPSFEPLMATRPVKAAPEATPHLSLDLSLDDPASGQGAFVEDAHAHIDLPAMDVPPATPSPSKDKGNEIAFEHIDITSPDKG